MIVDSDVVIDLLRNQPLAVDFFQQALAGSHAPELSVVTLTEVEAGLHEAERPRFEGFVAKLRRYPADEAIARTAGTYLRRFARSHGLGLPDALIAATARHHGGILCTLNRKHYPMSDIEVRVPYKKG